MKQCDVLVVGASFAGLSFARHAAEKGLDVIVIDKDPAPGKYVRTTGILLKEVLDNYNIPKQVVTNGIRRISIFSSSLKRRDFATKKARCFMTDTRKLLEWLAKEAEKKGAEIIGSAGFQKAEEKEGELIALTTKKGLRIKTYFIVGADGAVSRVAKNFKLDTNKKILQGFEYLLENIKMPADSWYLLADYRLAPGYVVWLAPNKNQVHFGVVKHPGSLNPKKSLELAKKKIKPVLDLSKARVAETRAGLVPIGGVLKKIYNNKCLLIGDAAGMCGAMTCGGILQAVMNGEAGADAVHDLLVNKKKKALASIPCRMNKKLRISEYIKREEKVRILYGLMNSNHKIEQGLEIFDSKEGRRILDYAFFEYRIGMRKIPIARFLVQLLKNKKLYPKLIKIFPKEKLKRLNITRIKRFLK